MKRIHQAVFLDRDGTLNVDDYVTYRAEQFRLIDGAREGTQLLAACGFMLLVVTNQSGIGRGDYRVEDMHAFHRLLVAALPSAGLTLADFYYCPHDPQKERCDCSKPNPGLLLRAARERAVDLSQSYMIGDKLSDILAGQRAGCKKTILVQTGITDDAGKYAVTPDYVASSLLEAARFIAQVEQIEIP